MCVWLTDLLRRYRRDERGVMAVEFGLILPVLFVVLVGIFEFGRYLNQYTVLEQAIRTGVAYAARYDDHDDLAVTKDSEVDVLDLSKGIIEIAHVIRYGNPSPGVSPTPILEGFNETGANAPEIIITVYERDSLSGNATDPISNNVYAGTASAFVIRIHVKVLYLPFVSGYMSRFGQMWMQPFHEQVWIGMS